MEELPQLGLAMNERSLQQSFLSSADIHLHLKFNIHYTSQSCWPRINVQCMSTPRESDGQWRRKTLTADRSIPSACVLQNDITPIGFLWLSHPFHLSSCFTFGHGGCSLQRDVFINHVKPQCMNVSLVQSHHYDCIWLKKKRAEYRVQL